MARARWAIILAALASTPWVADRYVLEVLTVAVIQFVGAAGLAVLFGQAGQLVLCQGLFVGLGGYALALLRTEHGWGLFSALGAAVLVGGTVGFLAGVSARRICGHYLAIFTIALSTLGYYATLALPGLTGGAAGMTNVPAPGGWLVEPRFYFILCLVFASASGAYFTAVVHSPLGVALAALRANELLTSTSGVNTWRLKEVAFAASGALGGLCGALYTQHLRIVTPEDFALSKSVSLLLVVALAGRNSLPGLIAATVLVSVIPEVLRVANSLRFALFGLIVFALTLAWPSGLGGLMERAATWLATPLGRKRSHGRR